MRALVIVAALLIVAGCKGKQKASDTGAKVVDWAACDAALDKAASAPLAARPQLVVDGCRVCGADWKPLLAWNQEPASGGPKREQIEQLMVACNAFCTGDSKLKFMATLDKARGHGVNTPWRQLESSCKHTVNGAPDDRFMSAPFFALDRIARAATARGGATAAKVVAVELPLPALTVSGAGVELPQVDPGRVSADGSALHITLLADSLYVGTLPRGKLSANGVEVGVVAYPGEQVAVDKLGEKLAALAAAGKPVVLILAPKAMSAQKLIPVIAAASPIATLHLAARAGESPEGWQLPGAIRTPVDAALISDAMTVQELAEALIAK